MHNPFSQPLFAFFLVGLIGNVSQVSAGISGVGNTGDSSIVFEFAKSTAIAVIREVSPSGVLRISGKDSLRELYQECRQAMYIGAIRTVFREVEKIPDGNGYHALARRLPGHVIEISRSEMQRLLQAGTLTSTLVAAITLHEVGHDCVLHGTPVNDAYDDRLNELGMSLLKASSSQSLAYFLDVELIARLKQGEPIGFLDLSSHARQIITRKYLDYVGDWAFLQNRNLFQDRPASASNFYADFNSSWFRGWGNIGLSQLGAPESLQIIVRNILRASFETENLSYFDGKQNRPLPVELSCQYVESHGEALAAADCMLNVSWSPLLSAGLAAIRQKIFFSIDLLGEVRFRKLEILF